MRAARIHRCLRSNCLRLPSCSLPNCRLLLRCVVTCIQLQRLSACYYLLIIYGLLAHTPVNPGRINMLIPNGVWPSAAVQMRLHARFTPLRVRLMCFFYSFFYAMHFYAMLACLLCFIFGVFLVGGGNRLLTTSRQPYA